MQYLAWIGNGGFINEGESVEQQVLLPIVLQHMRSMHVWLRKSQ